ncbi:MAG TPA: type II secretion system F family protein, partial [Firmicutes bacterium]|nr:type II secretion system F family protein [Bacillota bacterium]
AAANLGQALDRLHAEGLYVVDLRPARLYLGLVQSALPKAHGPLPLASLAAFLRGLGSLLQAGLPLLACLTVLEEEAVGPALRTACEHVKRSLAEGQSLSFALAQQGKRFPPFLIAMIKTAEATGKLDVVCTRLAQNYLRELRLRQKLGQAAAYPLFVLGLAGVVSVVMIQVVLPPFLSLVSEVEAALPAPTRLLLALSQWDNQLRLGAAIGAVALLAGLALATPTGRVLRDDLLLRVPFLKELLVKTHLLRLAQTLSLCLAGGLSLPQALDLAQGSVFNHRLRKEVQLLGEGVRAGNNLSSLLHRARGCPTRLVQMVRVGEEAGTLEQMLAQAADLYEEEVNRFLTVLAAVAEPALLLVAGVAVLFVLLALVLPLLSVMEALG